jgi:hypothetical protein
LKIQTRRPRRSWYSGGDVKKCQRRLIFSGRLQNQDNKKIPPIPPPPLQPARSVSTITEQPTPNNRSTHTTGHGKFAVDGSLFGSSGKARQRKGRMQDLHSAMKGSDFPSRHIPAPERLKFSRI